MGTLDESVTPVNAAVHYAMRHRWRVLPVHGIRADGCCTCGRVACATPGKHPRLTRWPELATTDTDLIGRWFTWWPDANVGIATGDGLLVPDVDGDAGVETLAELERQHGDLPDTPRGLTGGGGVHYLFKVDEPVRNKVAIAAGLDIRGDHGFIVAPPSLHVSGRRYSWDISAHPDETPLAPAPRWLLDLIAGATHRPASTPGEELRLVQGERNDRLFRLACRWRRDGMGAAALREMLDAVNRHHCVPPLDDPAELDRIAASAAHYSPASEEDAATDALLAQALGVTA
jgi:putative DNA primase/helicase